MRSPKPHQRLMVLGWNSRQVFLTTWKEDPVIARERGASRKE
jgi:hypothetical protein